MFGSRSKERARVLSQVATIALIAGISAGCSMDMSRFADDVMTGSTSNQKRIVSSGRQSPTYDEVITGSVASSPTQAGTSQQLPPARTSSAPTVSRATLPPAAAGRPNSSISVYNPPASVVPASAPSAPAPIASAGTAKGGWTSVGGTKVTAHEGESLKTLSRRYGVPERAMHSANPSLSPSARLAGGQQVVIPTFVQGGPEYAQPNYASNAVRPGPVRVANTAPQAQSMKPDMITTGSVDRSAAPRPTAKPGRRVASLPPALPAAPASARPVPSRASTVPAAGVAAGVHVVNSGESLSGIAARYGLSSRDLQAANNISDPNSIRIGQRLRVPSGPVSVVAAPSPESSRAPTPVTVAGLPQRKPHTITARQSAPARPIAVARNTPASEPDPIVTGSVSSNSVTNEPARVASAPKNGPSFRWPVRGRIVSGFGDKPSGKRNDGINLAVPEGTSVKAAEDGVVIYSGNELKGFGNLLLVRHSGGWVTAYGHNSELLVRRGDTVRRGQVIARAGATGSVTQPQVHFELRQGSRPVDPQPYLAGT